MWGQPPRLSAERSEARRKLAPSHHLRRSSAIHIRLIKHNLIPHMRRPRSQHLLFPVNQSARIKSRQLKPMPMRNCIRRASLHAISTKNTTVVIDV